MPEYRIYSAILTSLIVLIAGCERQPPADVIRDDLDRIVDIDPPVQRVATLAPNLTEIVFAAGGGAHVVGVGMPDDYPPAVDTLPRFSTYPLDFEAVVRLQPDLVLATTQINSPRDAETLAALGIPTYFFSFQSIDDVLRGTDTAGELLGTPNVARQTVDSLRHVMDHLAERIESIEERPRVLYLIGRETLYSFGSGSYVHELIALAGGRSITRTLDTAAPMLSEEWVITHEPDVIIGPWNAGVNAADLLEHHPTWTVVPAVRTGRIYGIDPSLIERPGPRIIAGAREIALALHPDKFTNEPAP